MSRPISIKHGSIVVKIYATPTRYRPGRSIRNPQSAIRNRLYRAWTVVHYNETGRVREKFSALLRARARAEIIAAQLANGQLLVAELTNADQAALVRSQQLLAPSKTPLEVASAQYAEAHAISRGHVVEAAREYDARHPVWMATRTVAQVVAEHLEEQRSIGSSEKHRADLLSRLTRFAWHFQCDIASVLGRDIAAWLKGLDLSLRSRNNYRAAVQSLIEFTRTRKYLPAHWDELDAVPHAKAPPGKVQVFTPDEMTALLAAATAHPRPSVRAIVPWLALRAFAGIRHAEACRLHWPDVNLSAKWLIMPPSITKTKAGRRIPITPNLRRWLTAHRQTKGLVVETVNVSNALVTAQRAAGMEPRHNALRDSFSSYAMALHQNAAMVSEWTGNSPRRLRESYTAHRLADGKVITPELARRWFAINPPRTKTNIQKVKFA